MQLSLNDFGSDEKPLDIPSKKWEDILAISVLPGALDSLCVHMAQYPDNWLSWYKSARPERLALPVTVDTSDTGTILFCTNVWSTQEQYNNYMSHIMKLHKDSETVGHCLRLR